jgi:hypothetical protein
LGGRGEGNKEAFGIFGWGAEFGVVAIGVEDIVLLLVVDFYVWHFF